MNTSIIIGILAMVYAFVGYTIAYFKIPSGSFVVRILRSTVLALFWPVVAVAV